MVKIATILAVVACGSGIFAGCASLSSRSGKACVNEIPSPKLDGVIDESSATKPHPVLNRIERKLEWPRRIFGGHAAGDPADDQISAETRALLDEYLTRHDVDNLNIVFNEYNTSDSFRRLRNNPHVSPAVKYTAGMATLAGGGLVSNRVFDRNVYNPFMNTLELNSDRPAEILALAAVARRNQDLSHSDGYAMLSAMPVASSIIHAQGANDAAEFANDAELWEVEQQAHRDVYKHGSRATTMAVMPVAPFYAMPLIAVGGNLTARRLAQRRITRREQERLAGRDETEITSVTKPGDD